jgi:hypothetical protein
MQFLVEWEGPAIHAPVVLFDETQADKLPASEQARAIAEWIAVRGLSDPFNPIHPANVVIRAKVIDFLKAWRARFGQAKIDEIKQELIQEMERCREYRKISDQELQQRIELLFDAINN